MRITDFEELIRQLPYEHQAFDVNHKNWKDVGQSEIINEIFRDQKSVSISRFELFHSTWDIKSFVIKLLMWGYPTKGRGNNIKNLLIPENFELLISKLSNAIQKKYLTNDEVKELMNGVEGLGLSTLTKILYFNRVIIEKYPALIFDQRVINSINSDTKFLDNDIERFKKLNYTNAIDHYLYYLSYVDYLSRSMNVLPDQIEMFLFMFGTTLKEPEGDGRDWGDLD